MAKTRAPRTGRPKRPLLERFYKMFPDRPPGGCWENPNKKAGKYGTITLENGSQEGCHRVSYRLFVGPIPDGMDIDHVVCNNTRCANWAHLKPATRLENLQRSRAYNMVVAATGVCGEGHSMVDAYVKANGRQCRTCHLVKGAARQHANRARANYRRRAHQAVAAGLAEYVPSWRSVT